MNKTIKQLSALLSAGKASSVELCQDYLAHIQTQNATLNAFISVDNDKTLAEARAADALRTSGQAGLLTGVPIAHKDIFCAEGWLTTCGSKILSNFVSPYDAHVIEQFKAAGMPCLGKTNMDEFAMGSSNETSFYGPVRNPWNTGHIAGGSSGGSGASVAAGMCVGSIGSDTAGSIRLPASFNGVAGLRPTVGRISGSGALPVSPPFDTLGPLARRVSDVARIFAAIAGHDPADPISVDRPVPNFLATLNEPVAGLRIGVMRRWFFDDLDPDIAAAMERAIEVFRSLGVELVDIDLVEPENAQQNLTFTMGPADAMRLHAERIAERESDYGADVLMRMRLGEKVTGMQYAQSMRWMEKWRHRLRGVFQGVDAILSPTTPATAPASQGLDFGEAIRRIPRFSCVWPIAGIPSLAVPCGLSSQSLPMSLELAGAWFDEPTVLRLGHAFQGATDHHLRTAPGLDA